MIKYFLSLFLILFTACSSKPKRSYEVNALEDRADKYIQLADQYRMKGQYKDAHQYYQSAMDLYFIKRENQKYILTGLKRAILFIREEKVQEYKDLVFKIRNINRIENVGLLSDIDSVEARHLFSLGKVDQGVDLINKIIRRKNNQREKRAYYKCLLADRAMDQLGAKMAEELKDELEELRDEYQDGNLKNVEIYTYCLPVAAKALLKAQDFESSYEIIRESEKVYKDLEILSQMKKVLGLYIDYYEATGNQQSFAHYHQLLERHNKLLQSIN